MANQKFTFTGEEIRSRYADHFELAQSYLMVMVTNSTSHGTEQEISFSINKRRLYLAIESTYQDIARYKNYHQEDPWNEKLDATKRGAFLIKWITRTKPIDATIGDNFEPDLSSEGFDPFEMINELLALYFADIHMSIDVGIDLELSDGKRHEFVYDMLYREVNTDSWISILQLIKDSSPQAGKVPFLNKL